MITTCDGGDEEDDELLSPSTVGDDPGMKVLLEVKSPDITPGKYDGCSHISYIITCKLCETNMITWRFLRSVVQRKGIR